MAHGSGEAAYSEVFLKVVAGPDKGRGWELACQQSYTLGRSRKCAVRLEDNTVSGRHAQINCEDGVWVVTDLGSSHGTRVNKQKIMARKPLFDRDYIQVGKTLLEFREYEELDEIDLAMIDDGISMSE